MCKQQTHLCGHVVPESYRCHGDEAEVETLLVGPGCFLGLEDYRHEQQDNNHQSEGAGKDLCSGYLLEGVSSHAQPHAHAKILKSEDENTN